MLNKNVYERGGRGGGRGRGQDGGRGNGRGGLRGGRGRGNVGSIELNLAIPGTSSRSIEDERLLIKKAAAQTKAILKKMPPAVREELTMRKRTKELSRSLLPDAPPRKRGRKQQSPEREECRLISGTPAIPPEPKLQSWQKTQSIQIEEVTDYEVEELLVDWTTGELKPVLAAETSPPPPPAKAETLKLINKAVRDSGSIPDNAADQLATWLGEHSDDDLDDLDNDPDIKFEYDITCLTPAHIFDDLDHNTQIWMKNEDSNSDAHIHKLLPTDYLTFDWNCDHKTFKGQRETFTGQSGPTFPVTAETRPIDIFLKFFDDELFEIFTRQTNKYATVQIDKYLTDHSRLNYFKNVDRDEMAVFIAIIILQGLLPMPVENKYWGENGYLTLERFKDLMRYNRFILLKRLLHFSDLSDSDLTPLTQDEKKLRKIQPVLDFLNKKFSSLYLPGQNICIDESLLKWQGRLSFAQKITSKAAKVGVKSYELCESATGYLWSFFVYTGKTETKTDRPIDGQTDETTQRTTDRPTNRCADGLPATTTTKIVHDLAEPLFGRGHTLIMDNFYNSPLLARYLKTRCTDCYGTLRVNREFVPEAVKSISKYELRTGEMVQSFTHDLNVMMWRDTNIVSMVSTYHGGAVGGKEKHGRYKYKPEIVLDYNLAMGGVDKKDQLLSAFPMERERNQTWYKKVFRRLLNCTLLNCYIIYKTHNTHTTQRRFRNQLAEELIKTFKQPVVERPMMVVTSKYMLGPKKSKIRPILQGNHFIGEGRSKYLTCVWCKKSRTKYICKQCEVPLCLQICFEEYHSSCTAPTLI